MKRPTRPVLRYFGGKWMLAPWIIRHFPAHRIYVEPYAGAASVLLRKPRSYAEVYNDLDDEVVNLFRVLRDPELGARLIAQVGLTPFSRTEFQAAYEVVEEPVERARRLVVRSYQAHGANGVHLNRSSGFRANGLSANTSPARDWASLPGPLGAVVERLRGVTIESRPALDIIARFNAGNSLLYVDPPYVPSTRSQKHHGAEQYHAYPCDMTEADHESLLDVLLASPSMIVLSGYRCELYDDRLEGWARSDVDTTADGGRARTESLWVNPAAVAASGMFIGG